MRVSAALSTHNPDGDGCDWSLTAALFARPTPDVAVRPMGSGSGESGP